MKKHIAKFLTIALVLTSAISFSPMTNGVDVVSAATGETTTPAATPAKPVATTTKTTVAATSANISRLLKTGSTGSEVKTLQTLLNNKGYKLTVDGIYGTLTHHAVVDFQKKNGLTADGMVGAKTLAVLSPVVAAPVAVKPATPVVTAPVVVAKKLFHGFGESANYRVRGEKKDQLNITTASAIFDEDGKIVDLTWDVMEITYTLFPGWLDPKADQATKDAFVKSIDDVWETKVEEGYSYDMTGLISKGVASNASKKEWFEQLDYFETFFKGKTVTEVDEWFKKFTDKAGRPYKMAYPDKLTADDKLVTDKFTAAEKAMLVDVTTSATMSLEDPHSHFITALKEAYKARQEVK